ncbi:MAG: cytochrome b/b6 domain-containing protein [Bacteroidales bacterium]
MTEERIYLYPVWIRLWHLLNAIVCLTLIITGISMQFSNPKFPMIRFNVAVSIHNIAGIILCISYILFFIGNLLTSNGKYYKPIISGFFNRLKTQFIYYTVGLFKGKIPPYPVTLERKFNPLQQVTYIGTMYLLVPLSFITGLAMLYPEIIPIRIFWSSGLHFTDLIHITAGFLISVFMVIHIYFCTIGTTPLSNFKGMIDGYHESH